MTSKVGLLSGGQRQALTLLMATLKKPKLLLLDEHTAALDPKTAAKVLDLSEKIVQENQPDHPDDHPQHEGRHQVRQPPDHDVRGPRHLRCDAVRKRSNLQVSDLLQRFEQVSDGEFANDRMLLS